MTLLDTLIQRWRCRVAAPWVPRGARVLDIGCLQGEFLESIRTHISSGVGIDRLAAAKHTHNITICPYTFATELPFQNSCFDVVILLATLEHLQQKELLAKECARVVATGGRVIVTVPEPAVDVLLTWLRALRLVDGMSLEEHHGFNPQDTLGLFSRESFALHKHACFQFGLNHLFVFERTDSAQRSPHVTAASPFYA